MGKLVGFDLAVLAKDNGYNELGIYYQWIDQDYPKCVLNYGNKQEFHYQKKYTEGENVFTITIPTQDELKNWFLKTHFIYILPIPTVTCCWTFKIIDVQCDPQKEIERPPYKEVDAFDYSTYEEAVEAGLKEAFNWIEKK